MADLAKKIRFLKYRKILWRSWPYLTYLNLYGLVIKSVLSLNKKNVKVLFINGMRRSGNHYLMKTLMESSTCSVIFYNNQIPGRELDIQHGIQTKKRISRKVLLLIGFEDLSIKEYHSAADFLMSKYGYNDEHLRLLITRDVRNLMASRLNHPHMAPELIKGCNNSIGKTRHLWKDHHEIGEASKHSLIRYKYLHKDLERLSLKEFFVDEIRESSQIQNRYGGGSSFSNQAFNSRYAKFKGDPTYLSLIDGLKILDERVHGSWKKP